MSPPTSTLSYIFPAKTRGPGGDVLRAGLPHSAGGAIRELLGARGTSPRPDWRPWPGAALCPKSRVQVGRPLGESQVKSGEVVCSGGGGTPRLPTGTPGPGPGTQRLHLEGAPVANLMVSEAASRGSPSAPAGGGIRAGRGVAEHFLLPAGAPGLLPGEDSGGGVGTARLRLRLRQAGGGRPALDLRRCAPRPPHPGLRAPSPAVPPPFLRPVPSRHRPCLNPFAAGPAAADTKPGTERQRPVAEGEWGEPGKGEEREGKGEKAPEEECAEYRRRLGTGRGGGCARTEEGRASPPSQFRLPASPVVWSVPGPAMPRRGRWWAGGGGWSRCPSLTHPPPSPGLICLMQCG